MSEFHVESLQDFDVAHPEISRGKLKSRSSPKTIGFEKSWSAPQYGWGIGIIVPYSISVLVHQRVLVRHKTVQQAVQRCLLS